MLRLLVLISAGIFGAYFFEQYTGVTLGISAVIHGLGGMVGQATGFEIFSGDLGGYGAASSVGGSMGSATSSLGASVSSNMGSIGGF